MRPEDLELEPARVRLEDVDSVAARAKRLVAKLNQRLRKHPLRAEDLGLTEDELADLGEEMLRESAPALPPVVHAGRRHGMSAGFASRVWPRRKLWRGPNQQSVLMLQVMGQMWDTWVRQGHHRGFGD